MTSSIYPLSITLAGTPITAANDIFTSDLDITTAMVKPGGGGIIRLYFSFVFASSPATVSVFDGGNLKGTINADNSSNVISNGLYRFDIDVESGDAINLQADEQITGINYVRVHLVQFGA